MCFTLCCLMLVVEKAIFYYQENHFKGRTFKIKVADASWAGTLEKMTQEKVSS